jgi:hypothetical protein
MWVICQVLAAGRVAHPFANLMEARLTLALVE